MNLRPWHWIWLCICISVTPVGAQQSLQTGVARQQFSLNIPPQPLEDALNSFSRQTHLKLAFYTDLGRGLISPRISGNYTLESALRLLLANTGLRFKYIDPDSVAILPNEPGANAPVDTSSIGMRLASESGEGAAPSAPRTGNSELDNDRADRAGSKTSGPKQTDKDQEHNKQNERGSESNRNQASTLLEDIVVTAQKRSEKLMDVPSSIGVVGGARLESLRVNSLSDLADYVPGLSVTDGGAPGSRIIEIRGLSTNYHPQAGALVGTYIDDLPVGDSTSNAHGGQYGLDLNPYDIEHIEVLKGPQGTLYGSNTMGGLIKYVLRRPDLTTFQAAAGADGGYTSGSDRANWGVRGAVNLPILQNSLAVRLSGFDKYTAGYIDNVTTGAKYINHSTERGGRGTLLWQVTDSFSVRATVLAQDVNAADMSGVTLNGATLQPLSGPFKISSHFAQPDTQRSRIYSLGIDWNLNFATLTSSTGWSRISTYQTSDFTGGFGLYTPGNPNALAPFFRSDQASKLVEEVRLASRENQRVQWMLGGYYTKEDAREGEYVPTFTPSYIPLPPADVILDFISAGGYKESAGFGNITYEFTDRFDVSGGARYSTYSLTSCIQRADGLFGGGATLASCHRLPSTGVTLWMANARFHLNQVAMLYARVATGYRPGQGCPTCGIPALGIPGIVNPDKTINYEAGFKGSFFDQRLQVDMSAFHINWTSIQLTTLTPQGLSYAGNGGTAVSNGIELTTAYQATEGLRLNATFAYTDAHLTQDAPGAGGKSGDQLPGSPRFTGSVTADYSRPLDERRTLLFGAAYRYRDAVVNQFVHTRHPFPLVPQNIVDLYTGLAMRDVTMRLYAANVLNNRSYAGLLYVDDPKTPKFVPVQPRTIGLSVDYRF